MTSADEIGRLSAVQLAKRVRDKALSATEVVESALARLEVLEPHLHAFCTPTPDLARETATRIDQEIAAGKDPGPLAGVPVGIKDLVVTKGIRTASGSAIYENFVADEDDIVVERLKAAGAVILGKTNVPEFGYSGVGHNPVFETTRNPWNTDMTPGGSSAGSGASIAAGVCPIAIGTDGGAAGCFHPVELGTRQRVPVAHIRTRADHREHECAVRNRATHRADMLERLPTRDAGIALVPTARIKRGSIRIPSAHCGLYGMKASMGRVPACRLLVATSTIRWCFALRQIPRRQGHGKTGGRRCSGSWGFKWRYWIQRNEFHRDCRTGRGREAALCASTFTKLRIA